MIVNILQTTLRIFHRSFCWSRRSCHPCIVISAKGRLSEILTHNGFAKRHIRSTRFTQFFRLHALTNAVLLVRSSRFSDFDLLVRIGIPCSRISTRKPCSRTTKSLRLALPSFLNSGIDFVPNSILVDVIVHGSVNGTHHISFAHQ